MLDGKRKALFVIGENPKLSDPDWNRLYAALKKLDFLAVQELFLSETSLVADVEKDSTFTNTERRCMRIHKAIEPVATALPDWEIISRLARAMGYAMQYDGPEARVSSSSSNTGRRPKRRMPRIPSS